MQGQCGLLLTLSVPFDPNLPSFLSVGVGPILFFSESYHLIYMRPLYAGHQGCEADYLDCLSGWSGRGGLWKVIAEGHQKPEM